MGLIEITGLPFPPTMNHRMIPFGGRLILSKPHRDYKKNLQMHLMKNHMKLDGSALIGKHLRVMIHYFGPRSAWYTKSGAIKKIDVENRHKALLDGVLPFLDLDDSQIFEIVICKIIDPPADKVTARILVEEV